VDDWRYPTDAELIEWQGARWASDGWGIWRQGVIPPRPKWIHISATMLDVMPLRHDRELTMHDVGIRIAGLDCRVFAEVVNGRGQGAMALQKDLLPEPPGLIDRWDGNEEANPICGFVGDDLVCAIMPVITEMVDWSAWRIELAKL
jgi:hypothetical protein